MLREDGSDWLLSEDCRDGLLKDVCREEFRREAWRLGLLREDCRDWRHREDWRSDEKPVESKAGGRPLRLIPRWVMVLARFPVLLPPLRLPNPDSSGSSGVCRGEGKCRLVRSGREPPVFSREFTGGMQGG